MALPIVRDVEVPARVVAQAGRAGMYHTTVEYTAPDGEVGQMRLDSLVSCCPKLPPIGTAGTLRCGATSSGLRWSFWADQVAK